MKTEKEQEYLDRIAELEKQLKRTHHKIKKDTYGLHWLDVPEAFEDDVENKLPILKEVKEKAIVNDDGKPTHILIEGDNYHALTCLNYTHKGKIDVIYIDPPYNTGNIEGRELFIYKDKRLIKSFPDGTAVPKDSPFRHSYWLSFMKKRLELAKNLLKETGVIFISIDDNEAAQLKLLCDNIFGENNIVGWVSVAKGTTTGQDAKSFGSSSDFLLVYGMNQFEVGKLELTEKDKKRFSREDERGKYSILQWRKTGKGDRREDRPNLFYSVIDPEGKEIYPIGPSGYESRWRGDKKNFKKLSKDGFVEWVEKNGGYQPYVKYYLEGRQKSPSSLWTDIDGNKKATIELKEIFGEIVFPNPKPTALIKRCIKIANCINPIVLDFFAGSGTTGQAILDLNFEDGSERQFILCTNNENNICTEVTYPRVANVINGYTNPKGTKIDSRGNSLKHYKTEFVGDHNILRANDSDKTELAHHAGEMLAIAENTLYEMVDLQTDFFQFFQNEKHYTAVYFREELEQFEEFRKKVMALENSVSVYVFSWGENEFADQFDDRDDIEVKPIPQPILEVYKTIYNLSD